MKLPYRNEFGPWPVADIVTNNVPLDEEVAAYMARQTPEHQELLALGLEGLHNRATPAFFEGPPVLEASAGMLVSFQEQKRVRAALGQYALQEDLPASRFVGYFNWPHYQSSSDISVAQTRREIDAFIERNPTVPFAYIEGPESSPLRMGRLRKRLTDWMLLLTASSTLGDVMFTHHDADMRLLSSRHVRMVHNRFTRHDFPFVSVTPHVYHWRCPSLPNMNSVVEWMDHPYVVAHTDRYYEPGPAFSARAYMATGYEEDRNLPETHTLLRAMHQGNARIHPARLWAPEATMMLDPRRFYYKLYHLGYSGEIDFWEANDLDLDLVNDYRTVRDEHFSRWPDITTQQRDRQLRYIGAPILYDIVLRQYRVHPAPNPARVLARSFGIAQSLRRRLGGPEDMFSSSLEWVRQRLPEIVELVEDKL